MSTYLGKKKQARIRAALDICWHWAERLEAVSAEQAAKELKDAVMAIKEVCALQ